MTLQPASRPRPAPRPRHAVDVFAGGDDLAALEAALTVRKMARDKGLPDPVGRTEVAGDCIVVKLLWPHLLLWFDMLEGLGQADVPDGYVGDHGEDRYERGGHRMQVVPHHRHGDFSVHGWTKAEDGRRQQWVLRPVNEPDCRRCGELPEPKRQPLSPEGWAQQRWFELTGHRWDEQAPEPATGPMPAVTA